jgi:hypothetical protein
LSAPAEYLCCIPRKLPDHLIVPAAERAVEHRYENHPEVGPDEGPLRKKLDAPAPPLRIAVLTSKYWGQDGAADLTVGFLDNAPADLQARILFHANRWGKRANIKFRISKTEPKIRITRTPGEGYYSYLGTDCETIPADRNTMNFDSFTMNTPDSEFYRVVPHEFGHAIGAPHEHQRKEFVEDLIVKRVIRLYQQTQGWSVPEIRQQVLTPLDDRTFVFSTPADTKSIMAYDIPPQLTRSGRGVIGGLDINDNDYRAVSIIYGTSRAA